MRPGYLSSHYRPHDCGVTIVMHALTLGVSTIKDGTPRSPKVFLLNTTGEVVSSFVHRGLRCLPPCYWPEALLSNRTLQGWC
jgi:hypothetical protein